MIRLFYACIFVVLLSACGEPEPEFPNAGSRVPGDEKSILMEDAEEFTSMGECLKNIKTKMSEYDASMLAEMNTPNGSQKGVIAMTSDDKKIVINCMKINRRHFDKVVLFVFEREE